MNLGVVSYCRITNNRVVIDDLPLEVARTDASWLVDVFHATSITYPKFFKMDNLAKAGFLGAELVARACHLNQTDLKEDVAVICCNSSSSLDDDSAYQKTIQSADDYYPSPAVFVYTLANIVTGEIAIRNKTMGESSFYVMQSFNPEKFQFFVESAFADETLQSCLCGWTEYNEGICDVLFCYVARNGLNMKQFNVETLQNLYK